MGVLFVVVVVCSYCGVSVLVVDVVLGTYCRWGSKNADNYTM